MRCQRESDAENLCSRLVGRRLFKAAPCLLHEAFRVSMVSRSARLALTGRLLLNFSASPVREWVRHQSTSGRFSLRLIWSWCREDVSRGDCRLRLSMARLSLFERRVTYLAPQPAETIQKRPNPNQKGEYNNEKKTINNIVAGAAVA